MSYVTSPVLSQNCPRKISKNLLIILLLTSSHICISIIAYRVEDHTSSHVVTYRYKTIVSQQVIRIFSNG